MRSFQIIRDDHKKKHFRWLNVFNDKNVKWAVDHISPDLL